MIATVCAAACALALTRSMDAILGDAVTWRLAPSISVAVVKDGTLAYAGARGSADLGGNRPTGVQTAYPIGSLGSLFILVAVMQLEAKGKIHLDDTLQRYLPNEVPINVSLRELLVPQEGDATYDALAAVVESVSREPLITYLTDHVFRPAGMTQTWLGKPPDWMPLATGYYEWHNVFGEAQPDVDAWNRKCCSFVSTAADLARFDVALLNGRLVSPSTLRAMHPYFHLGQMRGMQAIGMEGSAAGYDAQNVLFAKERFAIVTLTNSAGFAAPAVLDRVLAVYYPNAASVTTSESIGVDRQITDRLRRFLSEQPAIHGPIGAMDFLSSSESAGSKEYRYLVDLDGRTRSVFFAVNAGGAIEEFWLH